MCIDVVLRDVSVTEEISKADEDQYTYDHVHDDTTQHDDQPLPGGLAAEFPRLSRTFHLVFVHALLDHPRDLDVATERKPSHSKFSVAAFYFKQGKVENVGHRKEEVEEQVELLDFDFEQSCGDEMAPLMHDYQNREAQQKLGRHDHSFHSFFFP